MNWEKLYPNLNFTVENKMGNLHKIEFRTHWEFCSSNKIFGLRKSPEYLYRLSDVLPKRTTCEMETPSSAGLHSAIISWSVGS